MKKLFLIGAFMFSFVSFASETKKDVITSIEPNNTENVVISENTEEIAVLYCVTETYTHTRVTREISMYPGHYTEVTETYTSGACTRCYTTGANNGTFTIDCWGTRFPPIGW